MRNGKVELEGEDRQKEREEKEERDEGEGLQCLREERSVKVERWAMEAEDGRSDLDEGRREREERRVIQRKCWV